MCLQKKKTTVGRVLTLDRDFIQVQWLIHWPYRGSIKTWPAA